MNFVFEDITKLSNFISCHDVNASGIPRFTYSPIVSTANIVYSHNKMLNPIRQIPLNHNSTQYIISACVNHSPDDWTGYYPKVNSLFSYLNPKYMKDLQDRKAMLLLDQSLEGYQTNWLWDFFHRDCAIYSISPSSIIYVTGNIIANESYTKWADSFGITDRMKIISYTHFEMDVAMSARMKSLPLFKNHIEHNKIKTFACLNKRIRPHRVWFYRHLYDAGLISKGLISMNSFDKHDWEWEGKSIGMETIEKISSILPLKIYDIPNDEFDDSYYIYRFNNRVCLDTYVSIISEAHCGDSDDTLFISEKTFKPIACRQPFLIMGNKNSLSKLRELGYKTFEGFIDESYDSLSTHERMEAIINSVQKIDDISDKLEWFKSMEGIIEHNYNVLRSKLLEIPRPFVDLTQYYNNFFGINNIIPMSKKLI